jgi:hypothetical protein
MYKFLLSLLLVLTITPVSTAQQSTPPDPLAAFDQLDALIGGWFHGSDQGDIVEEWKRDGAEALQGANYRVRMTDGDTAGEKTYRIELRPDGLYYVARFRAINNNQPIDYKLVYTEDFVGLRKFVFENTKFDYPKQVTYSIEAKRNMTVRLEGERNGKARSEETNYEREFAAAEKEMYLKFGVGAFKMKTSGFFFTDPDEQEPAYAWRPGWDLGAQLVFKGRGNFARFGLEVGLAGRYSFLDTASFTRTTDTTRFYLRDDVRYNQSRLYVAFTPELRLDKNDKITVFFGPYVSQQMITRAKGTIKPEQKGFNSNNDLKKTDFGIIAGLNFRLNPFTKDMGGRLGVRAWFGLANQDNLYTQGCTQCTGKVTQSGFSVYYAVNLLKS